MTTAYDMDRSTTIINAYFITCLYNRKLLLITRSSLIHYKLKHQLPSYLVVLQGIDCNRHVMTLFAGYGPRYAV